MSGPAERNVDGIASSVFDAAAVQMFDFMRLDLPSPNGIIRLTNYPNGYVGDIDGAGSQTWTHADLTVSSLTWAQQKPQDVSWVDIWNADNVWSTLLLNYDLEFKPVRLWQGWFNPATGAIYGRPQLWAGRTEHVAVMAGLGVRLSLVADRSQLAITAPFMSCLPSCQNVFKDGDSCQYAGIVKPASLTVSDGGIGGKNAGTYYYTVTALHGSEETDGVTGNVTIAVSHKVSLSWPAAAGATGYNVYGTANGDQKILLTPNGQNVQGTTFSDSIATPTRGSATPPGANGTGAATNCDHSVANCTARGNLTRFVGWRQMSDRPVLWSQRTT